MRRRSFLKWICGATAAVCVPAVRAAEKVTTETIDELVWTTTDSGKVINVTKQPIYSGDFCVWDNGAYRPANHPEDYRNSRMAIAVPDGSGGFTFARYPECMDVVIDIEIRG